MSTTMQSVEWSAEQQESFAKQVRSAWLVFNDWPDELRKQVIDYLIDGEDGTCLLQLPIKRGKDEKGKFFVTQRYQGSKPTSAKRAEKLVAASRLSPTPTGYYQRLGEVAAKIPEVSELTSSLDKDQAIPQWVSNLYAFSQVLEPETGRYHAGRHTENFQLMPWLLELEGTASPKEVTAFVETLLQAYGYRWSILGRCLCGAADLGDVLTRYRETVVRVLENAKVDQRIEVIDRLQATGFDLTSILPTLVLMAVGTSKTVREKVLPLLKLDQDQATKLVCEKLASKKAADRAQSVEALVLLQGEEALPMLKDALKNEKAARVKQTLESAIVGLTVAESASDDETNLAADFPPIDMPTGILPLPDGFAEAFQAELEAVSAKIQARYEKEMQRYQAADEKSRRYQPNQPNLISPEQVDAILSFVEGRIESIPDKHSFSWVYRNEIREWSRWFDLTQLHLVHVIRFHLAFEFLSVSERGLHFSNELWLNAHRAAQQTPYGFREVQAAIDATCDNPAACVARSYLSRNGSWYNFLDWEPEAVWPLFAERSDVLPETLSGPQRDRDQEVRNAIRVAGMMPRLPRSVEHAIWGVALGESKTNRPLARKALRNANGRLERGLAALTDGKQGVRIAAAELLADLADAEAASAIKKALQKEKLEIVKGSLLVALESCGGDVDEFLGKRKQLLDAKKGLEKKRPKGSEWVPLDSLPIVRWADDDKPVNREIVQWWVVQSIQFKMIDCGVILRRSLAMCRPDDVAALAQYLLSAWTTYDTAIRPHDEIVAEATKMAKNNYSTHSWIAKHYGSEAKYRDSLIAEMQTQFTGSAIGQKGILAIVSGGGDASCVKIIDRYIRKYHGHRLAQSKSLLEVLGWIDEPEAIQLLLSLANRFRTKGIQKRAAELVQEIASRQGWTMDELADRTIPDGGFVVAKDENDQPIGDRPELLLDYGARKFTVILGDTLEAVITRDDGKQVKALPAKAKDDDEELVKAAKKEFSAAKKTVKEVVKTQADRLYEAACVQRAWPAEQWKQYLLNHAIMGALCRRVVWSAQQPTPDGQASQHPVRLFRPLEDGTLTDVEDEEFILSDEDQVRVAHASLLDEETAQAWMQHLDDYDVPKLFDQFGRKTYRLPKEKAEQKETQLTDFEGHMLTTFQLRSKATKLKWMRGEIVDGGSFGEYTKTFPSQRVMAVLEFTGSYVPEEDLAAGLRSLSFQQLPPSGEEVSTYLTSKIPLSDVPPVLLSECYNDYADIAAVGTGFDKDWQSKGLW